MIIKKIIDKFRYEKKIEKYRLLLESSKDYFIFLYKLYPVRKFDYASPSSSNICGYTPEEFYKNKDLFLKIIYPEDFPLYEFQKNFPELTKNPIVMRWRRKDGKIIWTEHRYTNLYKNNKIVAYVGIVKDITEQKETEFALRESEGKYRELFKNANDYIFLFEYSDIPENWKLLEINDIARNKFIPEKEFPGINEIIDAGSLIEFKNKMVSLPEIKYLNLESVFSVNNKEKILVDINAGLFKLMGKKVILLIARDITEKRKIENELHKRQKLESLALLSGGIAHDFNNLLTAILGNISLAHFNSSQEEIFKHLDDVENVINKAKNLTQQLLTFTKYDNSSKITGSIGKLVKDISIFITTGSKCKCEFNINPELDCIDYDEDQMIQIINNIVLNAMQSMDNGGIINITVDNEYIKNNELIPEGKYVVMKFIDHGTGIAKENLGKIFDPFYTTKPKGSGLGLTTTYSIIKKHNGIIYAESDPGNGTVFFIYLPVSKNRINHNDAEKDSLTIKGNGKILLMDDNEYIRDLAVKMIGELGYSIDTVKNGEEAIEIFKKFREKDPYDLVILDLTIKDGMGGKETVSELLKIDPEIKAIVTSGYSTDTSISDYKRLGFCDILNKPYSIDSVRKILIKYLKKS